MVTRKVAQKEIIEQFKMGVTKQINVFEREIKEKKRRSRDVEKNLINSLNDLELAKRQLMDLRKFSRDINSTINKQIKEIEGLPFVREVRLTTAGINVDVGKIEIRHRDTTYYIGDFTIMINPDGVDVKNRNPVMCEGDRDYQKCVMEHPHKSGRICFGGERQVKIYQHFKKFELKELVFMVYLFLKTYTERDKYYPISYWKQEAKRKERNQTMTITKDENIVVENKIEPIATIG